MRHRDVLLGQNVLGRDLRGGDVLLLGLALRLDLAARVVNLEPLRGLSAAAVLLALLFLLFLTFEFLLRPLLVRPLLDVGLVGSRSLELDRLLRWLVLLRFPGCSRVFSRDQALILGLIACHLNVGLSLFLLVLVNSLNESLLRPIIL